MNINLLHALVKNYELPLDAATIFVLDPGHLKAILDSE